MLPLLPLAETSWVFLAGTALGALAATLYDIRLWRTRWLLVPTLALCGPIASGLVLWRFGSLPAAGLGVELAWTALPILLLVAAAALVAALTRRILVLLARGRTRREAVAAHAGARRAFLRDAAALLPAGAFAVGAAGTWRNDRTRLVRVPLAFRDLPPDLIGLRILQLSDLHLGVGRIAADLQALLELTRAEPPDLIVLTGDVADKLDELEAGLAVVTGFAPRLGVYAALGNHEYLHDIQKTLPIYAKSSLKLLINEAHTLRVGAAALCIAGADDPAFVQPTRPFLAKAIAECARAAPHAAFKLLLCHRPEGFEAAAEHGFHLTLSGHTHGGQIGLFGRSAFEVLFGAPYLWGSYRRGPSRLYTTSGFGHWFPFRLNCPAEAPLIVLERG